MKKNILALILSCVLSATVFAGDTDKIHLASQSALVNSDFSKAIKLLTTVCQTGKAHGCRSLGLAYKYATPLQGGSQLKYREAYSEACVLGDGCACLSLGSVYESGDGVRQDKIKAYGFYTKACERGSSEGCANIKDEDREQAILKAVQFLTKACDRGDKEKCYELGVRYEVGNSGVKKDTLKAKDLFGKACDIDYAAGCRKYEYLNRQQ